MAIPQRYLGKDTWPHVFVRTGETRALPPIDRRIVPGPRMAIKNYCRECHKEWWVGLEPRPLEVCPARNDKKERRRLLG